MTEHVALYLNASSRGGRHYHRIGTRINLAQFFMLYNMQGVYTQPLQIVILAMCTMMCSGMTENTSSYETW